MQEYRLELGEDEYQVTLEFGKYHGNGRTAITVVDATFGEDLLVATVNIPEASLEEGETVIKDYSENAGILAFLIENGIVSKPVRTVSTGFASVSVVKLLINP
jgi:hypothetical protein